MFFISTYILYTSFWLSNIDESKIVRLGVKTGTFFLDQNSERSPIYFRILLSLLQALSLIAYSKINTLFELRI